MRFQQFSKTLCFGASLLALFVSTSAVASVQVASPYIPGAQVVGQAQLKVLFWPVFNARLIAAPSGYTPDQPFALSLSYLRDIDRDTLIDSSISEMAAQRPASTATLSTWAAQLADVLPDVQRGDILTGVRSAQESTVFYLGDRRLGEIEDPGFTSAFFDIWLGEKASRPRVRAQLVGELAR